MPTSSHETEPYPPELLTRLRACRHLLVLTGAGVSQKSGIPTFRDVLSGLWGRFDPAQLATPEAFDADPALGWYAWRRAQVLLCEPNPAHLAIAALAKRVPHPSARSWHLSTGAKPSEILGWLRPDQEDPPERSKIWGQTLRGRPLPKLGTFQAAPSQVSVVIVDMLPGISTSRFFGPSARWRRRRRFFSMRCWMRGARQCVADPGANGEHRNRFWSPPLMALT